MLPGARPGTLRVEATTRVQEKRVDADQKRVKEMEKEIFLQEVDLQIEMP